MWVPTSAKILYDPHRPGIRKVRPGSLVVANVDPGIAEYYRWWVKKRHGLFLHNTAWIPHVTILDGKKQAKLDMSAWKRHHNVMIDIEYSVELEQHWKFWVLPVRSNSLMMLRKELGLTPAYNFHITFGRME